MLVKVRKYDDGTPVLGIYADINKVCICAVNVFLMKDNIVRHGKKCFYKKWEVLNEYVTENIDIDECLDKSRKFIYEYKVKQAFCNSIGIELCEIKDKFDNSNQQYEGCEIIELQPENMMFLVQGHIKRIAIKNEYKTNWEDEFYNFDIEALRDNSINYPRVFALANVIKGAQPYRAASLLEFKICGVD